ncbi:MULTISPECIES: hypothetical protein [Flavobacterium]|uniref:Uncharacterized protein n=1 Tax=Flavobacterium keumense TaxID=1306518 RepID=A0ABY8N7E0_9FLAO|nr:MULTISPECIES: hypothetical protein [Flavobacterium]WGK94756.1 hypothetical protein MG292_00585 [Flavobacterium keumense]
MKKILFFIFFTSVLYSQSKGIAYQAVIVRPNVQTLPGVDIPSSPLINSDICLKFSFTDSSNSLEYQEVIKTITNQYGVVNVTIGKGTQIGGYASSFTAIAWNTTDKNLKVELDITSSCTSFELISEQSFSSAPFAFNAITANNVTGVVAIENGGTGATTTMEARTNLGLNNVDNTSDLNKPISKETQTALDAKANLASPTFTGTVSGITKSMVSLDQVDNTSDVNKPVSTATQIALDVKENSANKSVDVAIDATSDVKYPTVKAVKSYVDAISSSGIVDASSTVKGKIQLAGDLTGTADAPIIADGAVTNAKIASGIDKSKVGLDQVDNTSDANKPISKATQTLLAAKESISNKSVNVIVDGNSDLKYPTVKAIKSYVDSQSSSGVVDASSNVKGKIQLAGDLTGTAAAPLIADGAVTNVKIASGIDKSKVGLGNVDNTSDASKPVSIATQTALDAKANLDSPSFTGTVSGITKSMVGLSNVDNTSDASKPVSTATQTQLALKESLANKSIDVSSDAASDEKYPSVKAIKSYVDTQISSGVVDASSTVKGKIQLAGDLTGTADAPTITDGAVTNAKIASGIDKSKVGLSDVDNTSDLSKPVSTATQTALNAKANLDSPNFTGTVSGITKSMIGLNNVDNTSDASKPISTLTQTALDAKANLDSPSFTGTVSGITKSMIGLSNVDNTSDASKPVSTATQNALNLKLDSNKLGANGGVASLDSTGKIPSSQIPSVSFSSVNVVNSQSEMLALSNLVVGSIAVRTDNSKNYVLSASPTSVLSNWIELLNPDAPVQTVNGKTANVLITAGDINLGNVDNTSDLSKPVSTATQTALDAKANLDSPSFTGTVSGITKSMVGLSNVDNTSDASKPVSTATQTQLALKESLANKSIDVSSDAASDEKYPSVKAIKSYVDTQISSGVVDASSTVKGKIQLAGDLTGTADAPTIADGAVTNAKIASGIDKSKVGLSDVDNTSDLSKPVSTATQTALNAKANLDSPNFTGTVSGITKSMIGLNNVDNTSDASKPISTLTQTALDAKANLDSPSFTGTVSGITKSMIGLSNVDNTSDASKPVSTATQNALNLKLDSNKLGANGGVASLDSTGKIPSSQIPSVSFSSVNVVNSQSEMLALSNLVVGSIAVRTDNSKNYVLSASPTSVLSNWIELLNPDAPVQTVNGKTANVLITAGDINLGNVDNTSDLSKPVSTATQTALDAKANLDSPSFTGTVSGITKSMVGLSNVDNTSDASKPVSTATQTQLALKESLANKSIDVSSDAASDEKYPSVKAIKSYVDTQISSGVVDASSTVKGKIQLAGDLTGTADAPTIADGAVTNAKIASGIDKSKVGLSDVDNTSDLSKPVSTATQTALNAKANLASPTFTGTVTATNFSGNGSSLTNVNAATATFNIDQTSTSPNYIPFFSTVSGNLPFKIGASRLAFIPSTGTLSATKFSGDGSLLTSLNASNIASGTVAIANGGTGATTALAALTNLGAAPLASPSFTGTVSGITKSMVGLSNVDNTSDASKPVSTATQTQLALKESLANKSIDVSSDAASDEKYPSVKAIKSYVDTQISSGVVDASSTVKGKIQLAGDLTGTADAPTIADGAVTNAKIASGIDKSKVGLSDVDNTSDANKPISTATQTALDTKANLASPTFAGTVTATNFSGDGSSLSNLNASKINVTQNTAFGTNYIPFLSSSNGNNQILNGNSSLKFEPFSGTLTATKFSGDGTLLKIDASQIVAGIMPINSGGTGAMSASSALVNLGAAPLASPTFTGTVTANYFSGDGSSLSNVSATNATNVKVEDNSITSNTTYPIFATATFGNVKPHVAITNLTFIPSTGNLTAVSFTGIGSSLTNLNASNIGTGTLAIARGGTGATTASVALTNLGAAPLASPTFTGTISGNGSGITAINAGNISTGTLPIARGGTGATTASAALTNLGAAPLASPNFTGTVSGITNSMVGLGNVPNVDATNATNITSGTLANTRLPSTFLRGGINANYTNVLWNLRSGGTSGVIDNSAANYFLYTESNSQVLKFAVDTNGQVITPQIKLGGNDLQTTLNGKESTISAGTNTQYWRGDKSWQTLDKSSVGLDSVDNTSDASKPISTATQTALNDKGAVPRSFSSTEIPNITGALPGTLPDIETKYNFLRVRVRFGGFGTAWMFIDLRNSNSLYTLECPTTGTMDSTTQFRRYNIQVAYNATTRVLSITKVGMQTITAGSAGTITYTNYLNDAEYYLTDFWAVP